MCWQKKNKPCLYLTNGCPDLKLCAKVLLLRSAFLNAKIGNEKDGVL